MKTKLNLVGLRVGRLTVLSKHSEKLHHRHIQWLCRCDCGNECLVVTGKLTTGHKKSCGCLKASHGYAARRNGKVSPEYTAWQSMKARCFYPKHNGYEYYGGRGVTVASEWISDFSAFRAYIGDRPSKNHSLDRKDPNGNYEPGNVRWATLSEQARNKRCDNCTNNKNVIAALMLLLFQSK